MTVVAAPCIFPADFNQDGLVDQNDLVVFKECSTGPGVSYHPNHLPPGCTLTPDAQGRIAADLDNDGDVDQGDFGIFQRYYSGTNNLAHPL